ncbi:MAG: response regulator [Phycisphaerae bacterium]
MNPSPNDPILLVEDNADDVLLIRRAFARARILNEFRTVPDGEAAIDYLAGSGPYADRAAHPVPTLMLLDLKLPRKNGFEVITWARQHPEYRKLPIVVLTSSNQEPDISRAFSLGANSYLVKPVAFDDLLEMMKTVNFYWFVWGERPALQPDPQP